MSLFDLVGPFEVYEVVVEGRRVPFLKAHPLPGGVIGLTLDGRFGLDVSVGDAERIVPFIANCIAVALGYTCHPSAEMEGPVQANPFTRIIGLDVVASSDSELSQ